MLDALPDHVLAFVKPTAPVNRPPAVLIPSGRARPAGFPRGQRADRRPIQAGATDGQQCQEAIPQQAGDRQRRLQFLGRRQYEADVLLAELGGETGRLESLRR